MMTEHKTPPDRDLAPGEAPCVICMDDATKLVQGYSLCDEHAKQMSEGVTYWDMTEEFDLGDTFDAKVQHQLYIRQQIDSFLRSQSDDDLQLWMQFAVSSKWNETSRKRLEDEIERRKTAEPTMPTVPQDDADDLAHDLGVIIFAGIYMDGDDAESMRSEAGSEAYNAIRIGVDAMRGKLFELESILRDLLSFPHAWTYHEPGGPRTCGYCTRLLSDHEADCPIARAQKLIIPEILKQETK